MSTDVEVLSRIAQSQPLVSREHELKRDRVLGLMERFHLNALHLSTPANVAWYAGGGRPFVNVSGEKPLAEFVVTATEDHLFVNQTERARLLEEEFGAVHPVVHENVWWEDAERTRTIRSTMGGTIASDNEALKREVARLRYSLLPEEIARYRSLGADAAVALTESARRMRKGITEFEVAGDLAQQLLRTGIYPLVLLVAFDERKERFRHPLPTAKMLERSALISVCGVRNGLIASASRLVSVGEPSAEERRKHLAIATVDAWLIRHTTPQTSIAELFRGLKSRFALAGFSDEWRHHHQGGATGYSVRDYRADETSEETVQSNQAFAWNPTLPGSKSEDTILVGDHGFEVLTHDPNWPSIAVEVDGVTVVRPDILTID